MKKWIGSRREIAASSRGGGESDKRKHQKTLLERESELPKKRLRQYEERVVALGSFFSRTAEGFRSVTFLHGRFLDMLVRLSVGECAVRMRQILADLAKSRPSSCRRPNSWTTGRLVRLVFV